MHRFFFFMALLLLPLTAFGQTVFFKADGESGTVKPPWGGISTYSSKDYVVSSTERAKAGSRSYKFYVHSPADQANDAKVWTFPRKVDAHYSSWFYLAQGYEDNQWRNNFQFKTDNGGATVKGGPKIVSGFSIRNGVRQMAVSIPGCATVGKTKPIFTGVIDLKPTTSNCDLRQINPVAIPKNRWFHIEARLIATKTSGVLKIWQDGKLIFDLTHPNFDSLTTWGVDEPTKRSDNAYLYWTIGNYVSINAVGTQVLYADDTLITNYRISGSSPSLTVTAPQNLRIVEN